MSQSKTKTEHEESMSEEQIREVLDHWGIPYKDLNYAVNDDPEDIPYLVFNHETYLGIEAHLFTAADMALWLPELLPSGDVVVYYPIRRLDDGSQYSLARRREMVWDTVHCYLDNLGHQSVVPPETALGLNSVRELLCQSPSWFISVAEYIKTYSNLSNI